MHTRSSFLCLWITLFFFWSSPSRASDDRDSLSVLKPLQEHENVVHVILNLLDKYHYRKLTLNDSISKVLFENYISALDPLKIYFLNSEIAYFSKYANQLDDDLRLGNLDFAYQFFGLYREKAITRSKKIPLRMNQGFDFTIPETFENNPDKINWATNHEELNERWRKLLKNQALNLTVSGKDWEDTKEVLMNRYKRIQKSLYQYKSEDVFQLYMNSFTRVFDPHTAYFSPVAKDNFQIEMSLSLDGIGARLVQKLDYTLVYNVVMGGPAYKSKQLNKDDRIVGVAQGDDGEFVDVIGWRLDDVVSKIRGPKGSVVRLAILKADMEITDLPDTLRLVRDKIKLEEQSASAEIIPLSNNNQTYQLGVIRLPSFYIDFEAQRRGVKDYKSTTRDVRKLIDSLQTKKIDGLLIDLRFNGGGSLKEAIELTGLFIKDGPVVQVKNYNHSVDKLKDQDKGVLYYDGPLAVLINRYSASASEIFSAAIQDYQRGVIVGENSFGKGTVQNLLNLDQGVLKYLNKIVQANRMANNDIEESVLLRDGIRIGKIPLGQLKMTIAKFYRITGSSTQKMGVVPDVLFPTPVDAEDYGESSRQSALPWDEIETTSFQKLDDMDEKLLSMLVSAYQDHLESDPLLIDLQDDINKLKKEDRSSIISLNINDRQLKSSGKAELDTPIKNNESSLKEEKEKDELDEKISDDPYLKEAIKLLAVYAELSPG